MQQQGRAVVAVQRYDETARGMSAPVVVSLVFHACILLLAIVGIPYIVPKTPEIEQPIPVEVVTVAEKSQVNRPAATPQKFEIPKKAEEKEPPKPTPPTHTEKPPPAPTPPKPPEPVKAEPKPEPAEDALAPPEKELKKIKAPPKKPEKPVEKVEKADAQEDFNALLKNLEANKPTAAAPDAPVSDAQPTPNATLADQMTMSEMDAVRKQLGECWKLLAGARYAEDLVVEIRMIMNPDKSVQSAQIVDQLRYNADTFYRAAADSALRAVYDPHCNPLQQLPDGKYSQWKDMDVYFDPREMLQ